MTRPAIAVLGLAAAFSGGCTFGAAPSMHGVATSPPRTKRLEGIELVRLERYRGHGITFTYPATWRYRHRGFYTSMTSPVVDLSTQPTVNPCVHHGSSTGCWFPVRHLQRGAVVVMWSTGGMFAPSLKPVPGVHVRTLRRGCRRLGGGEEITATVVLRGGRVYQAAACLRGPDVALHEGEVRAMLASAKRADS
jgi:hypothetical protein